MAKAAYRVPVENGNPLSPRQTELTDKPKNVHIYNDHVRCVTDTRGFANHRDKTTTEIRVDATDGFIPLWDRNVTLRYRFDESSIRRFFANPTAAKNEILRLFGEALEAWGDAAPVRFKLDNDVSDFQLFMMPEKDCDSSGCVLASAFFPDGGRHNFRMYPTLFEQTEKEQVETFVHEIGHIFGLRHFFANISEKDAPSRLFGEDNAFSIMNYGSKSVLTDADRSDLKKLYQLVWNGELTKIDGAPIRLMRPFSSLATSSHPDALAANAMEATQPSTGPQSVQIYVGGRKITVE